VKTAWRSGRTTRTEGRDATRAARRARVDSAKRKTGEERQRGGGRSRHQHCSGTNGAKRARQMREPDRHAKRRAEHRATTVEGQQRADGTKKNPEEARTDGRVSVRQRRTIRRHGQRQQCTDCTGARPQAHALSREQRQRPTDRAESRAHRRRTTSRR